MDIQGITEAHYEARIHDLKTQLKMAQEETDELKVKIHETFKDTPVGYRIFGEALLNPEEQCHSIDMFLGKAKDYMLEDEETTEELEEEIGELKEKIEELETELQQDGLILKKYREEMSAIEEITGGEVEDIVDVKDYVKKLKQFKSDVIEALQFDDDLDDEDYISSIKDMEAQYDANKDESDDEE